MWDGNVLTLSGRNWSFSTLSAWRVLHDNVIEYACWDTQAPKIMAQFAEQKIIEANQQGAVIAVDPIFELSNGRKLEIFSSEMIEPWVLKLPNGQIFTGALENINSSSKFSAIVPQSNADMGIKYDDFWADMPIKAR